MNNFEKALEEFYLGTPKREPSGLVDEMKASDVFNIDNTSSTDSSGQYRQLEIAVTDPVTAPTTGANKAELRVPFDGILVGARSSLTTGPTASFSQVSLKNSSGQDILIGYLQINPGNTVSPAGTIDTTKNTFSNHDPIRVTVNTVGTSSKGLVVTLYFTVSALYTD